MGKIIVSDIKAVGSFFGITQAIETLNNPAATSGSKVEAGIGLLQLTIGGSEGGVHSL